MNARREIRRWSSSAGMAGTLAVVGAQGGNVEAMTTIDLAPRRPVTVHGVLDDPEAAWRLCEAHGPYPHVLMQREFAASLDAYKEAARAGSRDAVGVMADDELMTMPIFRGEYASAGQVHVPDVAEVLHNPRLVDAARQVFDAEIVRPFIVFSNLTAPMPRNKKHTDVPTFRGVERSQYPAWVVWSMAASGRFEPWRVKVATAVAWFYEGPNGGFSYWPDGGAAPEVTIEPPSNTAVVGDNDFMYHRVEQVGDGRIAMVPIDSLLSFDDARGRWEIAKGDRGFGDFGRDDIRISISWKAECFHDAEDARIHDEHLDDLAFDRVLEIWRSDCEERGIALPDTSDPLHDPVFAEAVAAAYDGFLNTA
jgi:hypothetical protein